MRIFRRWIYPGVLTVGFPSREEATFLLPSDYTTPVRWRSPFREWPSLTFSAKEKAMMVLEGGGALLPMITSWDAGESYLRSRS